MDDCVARSDARADSMCGSMTRMAAALLHGGPVARSASARARSAGWLLMVW